MTNGSWMKVKSIAECSLLMKVESIAECSHWSIQQYFWPALSDNWSWKPIFGLFESGRFAQVLLPWPGKTKTSLLSYWNYLEYRNFTCGKLSYSTFQRVNRKGADQPVWMQRLVCVIVVPVQQNQDFSQWGPLNSKYFFEPVYILVLRTHRLPPKLN